MSGPCGRCAELEALAERLIDENARLKSLAEEASRNASHYAKQSAKWQKQAEKAIGERDALLRKEA